MSVCLSHLMRVLHSYVLLNRSEALLHRRFLSYNLSLTCLSVCLSLIVYMSLLYVMFVPQVLSTRGLHVMVVRPRPYSVSAGSVQSVPASISALPVTMVTSTHFGTSSIVPLLHLQGSMSSASWLSFCLSVHMYTKEGRG